MTSIELEIVGLIEAGHTRREIATHLGLGQSTVRQVIKRLCLRYHCSKNELPEVTKKGEP